MAFVIEERVKDLIAEQLKIDVEQVTNDAYIADDLNADPYDLDELASLLCEEYYIEIDEDEIEHWNTVSDVVQTVVDKT